MTQAQFRRLAIVEAVVVAAIAAIFLISSAAGSDGQGRLTEEFHKVYPLSAQGRVEIANINGPVHITGWDRDEVKVDAVKSAWSKERLDEAKIEIRAEQNEIVPEAEILLQLIVDVWSQRLSRVSEARRAASSTGHLRPVS